jgi:phosphonate transport system permease protein
MSTAVALLPEDRLKSLERDYRDARRARLGWSVLAAGAVAMLTVVAGWAAEVDLAKLAANVGRFPNYIANLSPPLTWASPAADFAEWFWGWKLWGRLIIETLLIAYLGTFLGAVGALLLCFNAAANVAPSETIRFLTRRYLEFCRTVPEIVFALIFVVAFGLGPLPGALAIAIHTLGALGKQFAEAVENMDMKPIEGVKATGARWTETMRYAALPQVAANFVSYTLMRFEINVRGAAIMGFVGAGGIGQELLTAVRKFYYADISAMLVMIIAIVMIIDLITERLRLRFIEKAHT